jgi:hypothetical protein
MLLLKWDNYDLPVCPAPHKMVSVVKAQTDETFRSNPFYLQPSTAQIMPVTMASKGMHGHDQLGFQRPGSSGEPRSSLTRTGACENLRFWDRTARTSSTGLSSTSTWTDDDEEDAGSDVDTESTASESDGSPNSVAYYESRPAASRCRSANASSSSSSASRRCSSSGGGPPSPAQDLQGIMLPGRVGSREGPTRSPSKNNMKQQQRQDSSTTTVDGPRAHTSTTPSFTTRRRSSNIPIQRGTSTMNNKYDPEYHAEQALQAHLQQHYAMRTWDMYHRITQSRIHHHHTSNKKSPAKAASIDHCLLLQSTSNGPMCSWSVQPSSSPEQPVMDSMLEQDMLFPLDD